jgi:FAD-dependent urate hydroxylase
MRPSGRAGSASPASCSPLGSFDVVVAGGGLGGLTCALALIQDGHRPVIFEQTEQFRPVGAGISLWPNGVKVLGRLGLGDALAAIGGRMDRMGYGDRAGHPLTEFSLEPLYRSVGERAWPVARAELQDLLVEAVGADRITFGVRCQAVESDGSAATVVLDGGSRHDAEVVVGADGTHSLLRDWVLGEPCDHRYVGYVNFNTIVPADPAVVAPGLWWTWVGDGRRVSVMPIGGNRLYTFFDIPGPLDGPAGEDPVAILLDAFGDWAEPVRRVIGSIDPSRLNRVPIRDLPPLPRWHRGRVVLLGDAVHAMAPDLGQGGCQALEDGLYLSQLLSQDGIGPEEAFAVYEATRKPRAEDIVRRARRRSDVTHGTDPAATREWYDALESETGEGVIAGLVQSATGGPCD